MTATVWFNKNISSIYNVVEIIRAAQQPGEFRILCSHTQPDAPALKIANAAEVEPRAIGERAYLEYCLEIAKRHRVDVFVPGKMIREIVQARGRFEAIGTKILAAADAQTLKMLENKWVTNQRIPGEVAKLPETRLVNTLEEFDSAFGELRIRYPVICFKPAQSVFGLGFRILTENGGQLKRLLAGDPLKIELQEARRLFAEEARFRDLLVMQFLTGTERSVDCLGQNGELVQCVIRRKPDYSEAAQVIEDNAEVKEAVRRLTAHFGLTGMFNIQFRDYDGHPHFLEINPRMSGGIGMACLSGVAIPYWGLRLALGTATPGDVPSPQVGIRVKDVPRAVVL
ncbi:MAG: ATP-grasp domain-containing protein [Planctomyces sp.]|nr:ATP-grasp domain-containing protein [Planctomyces sp.]